VSTVGQQLLREAIERIGVEQVAARLEVSAHSLDAFRSGERSVSDAFLLRLIDLIESLSKKS
jgi:hypothetical protein